MLFQRFCRSRCLFHQRRILLGYIVHLGDRLIHLLDTGTLLNRRRADFCHDVGDPFDRIDYLVHGLACFVCEVGTHRDFIHGIVDQGLDFFCRRSRTLRQVAHLACHHSESASLLARTRGFHCRIQRQNIGLEGDAIDDADDVHNLLRAFADRGHGGDHFADHFATPNRDIGSSGSQLISLFGILGVLFHRRGEFFHAGGGFLQAGGLFLGALRQVGITGGYFLGCGVDGVARFLDTLDDLGQLLHRAVGIVLKLPKSTVVFVGNGFCQVALRQCGQHARHFIKPGCTGFHQIVHAHAQLLEKPFFALKIDTACKVSVGGGIDDVGHFLFHCNFGSAIAPLNGRTQTLALIVDHRAGRQCKCVASHPDLCGMRPIKICQQLLLVRRVLVELINIRAHQVVHAEIRQHLAHFAFSLGQQAGHRLVHIDDVAILVGDHYTGTNIIQSDLHAHGFIGKAVSIRNFESHADLHGFHRIHQLANFVIAFHINLVEIAPLGNISKLVAGKAECPTEIPG